MNNKFSAACFDLDGTLIDTETIHNSAEDECLKILGIDPKSPMRPRTFGMGIEPGMQLLADIFTLKSSTVLSTYTALWEKGLQSDLRLLPGAGKVLSWLSSHNIPLALVTSSDSDYVNLVDSVLDLKQMFDVLVTCDDVKRLKPDPTAYLEATRQLGVNPAFCVGFEDSGVGVTALNRAKVFSVAVHPDHKLRPELQTARLRVESLRGIQQNLSSWF